MAINSSRSMNGDLRKGMAEGKYKALRPNTGGDTSLNDAVNIADRSTLLPQDGYGPGGEAPHKILPDGSKG